MDNAKIAELLFEFQLATRSVNSPFSKAIERAILVALEYQKPLTSLSRNEMLKLNGFNQSNIDLVIRIINGESVVSVAQDVSAVTQKGSSPRGVTGPQNIYSEWKRTMKY